MKLEEAPFHLSLLYGILSRWPGLYLPVFCYVLKSEEQCTTTVENRNAQTICIWHTDPQTHVTVGDALGTESEEPGEIIGWNDVDESGTLSNNEIPSEGFYFVDRTNISVFPKMQDLELE